MANTRQNYRFSMGKSLILLYYAPIIFFFCHQQRCPRAGSVDGALRARSAPSSAPASALDGAIKFFLYAITRRHPASRDGALRARQRAVKRGRPRLTARCRARSAPSREAGCRRVMAYKKNLMAPSSALAGALDGALRARSAPSTEPARGQRC